MGTKAAGSVFGENSFYRETLGTRRWGRHVAKCSSDPRQAYPEVKLQGREAYPEVKLQGRDQVRVVGIVAPFAPLGVGTLGKFVLPSPGGGMGTCNLCRVPLAEVRHERARQLQGRDRVGIVEGSIGYQARGANIRYKSTEVAMWLNIVLTVASLPRSETLGTGPSACCEYCCPLCSTGRWYLGKIRFIEPHGGNGHRCHVPVASSSRSPRESQGNFRDETIC